MVHANVREGSRLIDRTPNASGSRRLLLAFAISIALHEVLAGLISGFAFQSPGDRSARVHVAIVHIAKLATPTPSPPPGIATVQPHVSNMRPSSSGSSPRRAFVLAFSGPQLRIKPEANPRWRLPPDGDHLGTTAVTSGNGNGSGPGTDAGTGSGPGTDAPCGDVEFSDPHGSRYDRRTGGFYVDIRVTMHFADGHTESTILDYPWYYSSEAANPWSAQNLRDPDLRVAFQPPPAGLLGSEPPLVQYVAAHSTSDGLTELAPCPETSPGATP